MTTAPPGVGDLWLCSSPLRQYHSKARVRSLFAFHSNYGSVLHHFRDKAICWSKIVICLRTRLHSTPRQGGRRRNIAILFGGEN